MTGSQIIIIELAGMAVCLLFFIHVIRKRHRLILQCRNEAPGEIAGIKVTAYGEAVTYRYQLIVSFDTGSGTVRGPDAWDIKKGVFSKGDQVTVRYNPDKPDRFYVIENHYPEHLMKVFLIILAGYPVLILLTYLTCK